MARLLHRHDGIFKDLVRQRQERDARVDHHRRTVLRREGIVAVLHVVKGILRRAERLDRHRDRQRTSPGGLRRLRTICFRCGGIRQEHHGGPDAFVFTREGSLAHRHRREKSPMPMQHGGKKRDEFRRQRQSLRDRFESRRNVPQALANRRGLLIGKRPFRGRVKEPRIVLLRHRASLLHVTVWDHTCILSPRVTYENDTTFVEERCKRHLYDTRKHATCQAAREK